MIPMMVLTGVMSGSRADEWKDNGGKRVKFGELRILLIEDKERLGNVGRGVGGTWNERPSRRSRECHYRREPRKKAHGEISRWHHSYEYVVSGIAA